MTDISLEIISSLSQISCEKWNEASGIDNPFSRYEFLSALEVAGCTTQETGWQPNHIIIYDNGQFIGAIPGYLKDHSYGEYVFDWRWAEAYEHYQMDYYPKLLSAIPFTPSAGPRLLLLGEYKTVDVVAGILAAVIEYLKQFNIPSWHLLFPDKLQFEVISRASDLTKNGLIERTDCQFHWQNNAYRCFDDFLDDLNSRKRKNIRKEREKVGLQGITFQTFEGDDIDSALLDVYYPFYQATYFKRGQSPYLSKRFFATICETIPEQVMLCMALKEGEFVAGALFFKSADTLYGRNWGGLDEYKNLHFECCYYQGIEYCIRHGIKYFDAGAQGEHKLKRGFRPVRTHSFHWIAHEGFQQAISEAVENEREHVDQYISDAKAHLPFKGPVMP